MDKIKNMYDTVSRALEAIAHLFKPDIKLSFIARSPDNPEGDVLIGDDEDPHELIALVERRFDLVPTQATRDVLAERRRHIEWEDWTLEHDDEHGAGQLSDAAGCYALHAHDWPDLNDCLPSHWPWAPKWWKPRDARSNLVRACALILAEIERLDRLTVLNQAGTGAVTERTAGENP